MTDKKDTKVDVPDVESFKVKSDDASNAKDTKDIKASERAADETTVEPYVEPTKEVPVTVHTPHEPDMTNPMINPQIPVYQDLSAVEPVALPEQDPAETQDIRFIPDPDADTVDTVEDEAEATAKSKSK